MRKKNERKKMTNEKRPQKDNARIGELADAPVDDAQYVVQIAYRDVAYAAKATMAQMNAVCAILGKFDSITVKVGGNAGAASPPKLSAGLEKMARTISNGGKATR